jgi:hypothetical protein
LLGCLRGTCTLSEIGRYIYHPTVHIVTPRIWDQNKSLSHVWPKRYKVFLPFSFFGPSNSIQRRGLYLIRHQTASNMLNSIWRHCGNNSTCPCLWQVSLSFFPDGRQIPTH